MQKNKIYRFYNTKTQSYFGKTYRVKPNHDWLNYGYNKSLVDKIQDGWEIHEFSVELINKIPLK